MLALTHAVLGCCLVVGIIKLDLFNTLNQSHILIATAIGSILPDDDLLKSIVDTHSLAVVSVISGILFVIAIFLHGSGLITVAFLIGYIFHLIADSFTIAGVRWFYPFSEFTTSSRIKTGSTGEKVFLCLVSALVLLHILAPESMRAFFGM